MTATDWEQVGAIATGVVALAAVVGAAALLRVAAAARRMDGERDERARRDAHLAGAVAAQVHWSASRAWAAQQQLAEVRHQTEVAERALSATNAPLLVPADLSPPGRPSGLSDLQVLLPAGVYYPPAGQSVGAWTIEPGDPQVVLSAAFVNVGAGPALLNPHHRIELVRRSTGEVLQSLYGYANGVVPVQGRVLLAGQLGGNGPAGAAAMSAGLALLDSPDADVQVVATLYYRSAAGERLLWTRVGYQRHLRTNPAGLLHDVSLEVAPPGGDPSP